MRSLIRCAARKCTNSTTQCSLSFFRFPPDVNRATIWLMASGREDLMKRVETLYNSAYRLCSIHFGKEMFANAKRNRLRREAVPKIFYTLEGGSNAAAAPQICSETTKYSEDEESGVHMLTPQEEKSLLTEGTSVLQTQTTPRSPPIERMTQTSIYLSAGTPRKRKLRSTIKKLRRQNALLKKKLKKIEEQMKQESYLNKDLRIECVNVGDNDIVNITQEEYSSHKNMEDVENMAYIKLENSSNLIKTEVPDLVFEDKGIEPAYVKIEKYEAETSVKSEEDSMVT